jgi:hypothetical protein
VDSTERLREGYWDSPSVNRELLIWAFATRRQLERWEPLVADSLRAEFKYPGTSPFTDWQIWETAIEHHFLLVAARNLIRAIELPGAGVTIDPTLRAELIEGRDLHEHWVENAPIFNVHPRREPKYRSGKDFAERNPQPSNYPYWWLGWNSRDGPRVLPNVPAHAIHKLVDRVGAVVTSRDPTLERFVPQRAPSPWAGEAAGDDRWWPRPVNGPLPDPPQ